MNSFQKLVLGSVLSLALIATGCVGPSARGSFERTLTLSGSARLYLTNRAGSVRISAGAPGQVHIQAQFRVVPWLWGNSRRRAADLSRNPPIRQEDNLIHVGFQRYGAAGISIDYVVEVPPNTEVHALNGSGDLRVDQVSGPVNASAGSGGVVLTQIQGDVHATIGSGSVRADGIQGSAQVTAGAGNVALNTVSGPLRVTTGAGNITLSSPGDTVSLRSGSGNIRITGASSDLRIRTGTGGVRVTGSPSPNSYWELRTGTGNVYLNVAKNAAFRFYAQSSTGNIHSSVPMSVLESGRRELRAVIGAGSARVEVRTGTGGVHLDASQP